MIFTTPSPLPVDTFLTALEPVKAGILSVAPDALAVAVGVFALRAGWRIFKHQLHDGGDWRDSFGGSEEADDAQWRKDQGELRKLGL